MTTNNSSTVSTALKLLQATIVTATMGNLSHLEVCGRTDGVKWDMEVVPFNVQVVELRVYGEHDWKAVSVEVLKGLAPAFLAMCGVSVECLPHMYSCSFLVTKVALT